MALFTDSIVPEETLDSRITRQRKNIFNRELGIPREYGTPEEEVARTQRLTTADDAETLDILRNQRMVMEDSARAATGLMGRANVREVAPNPLLALVPGQSPIDINNYRQLIDAHNTKAGTAPVGTKGFARDNLDVGQAVIVRPLSARTRLSDQEIAQSREAAAQSRIRELAWYRRTGSSGVREGVLDDDGKPVPYKEGVPAAEVEPYSAGKKARLRLFKELSRKGGRDMQSALDAAEAVGRAATGRSADVDVDQINQFLQVVGGLKPQTAQGRELLGLERTARKAMNDGAQEASKIIATLGEDGGAVALAGISNPMVKQIATEIVAHHLDVKRLAEAERRALKERDMKIVSDFRESVFFRQHKTAIGDEMVKNGIPRSTISDMTYEQMRDDPRTSQIFDEWREQYEDKALAPKRKGGGIVAGREYSRADLEAIAPLAAKLPVMREEVEALAEVSDDVVIANVEGYERDIQRRIENGETLSQAAASIKAGDPVLAGVSVEAFVKIVAPGALDRIESKVKPLLDSHHAAKIKDATEFMQKEMDDDALDDMTNSASIQLDDAVAEFGALRPGDAGYSELQARLMAIADERVTGVLHSTGRDIWDESQYADRVAKFGIKLNKSYAAKIDALRQEDAKHREEEADAEGRANDLIDSRGLKDFEGWAVTSQDGTTHPILFKQERTPLPTLDRQRAMATAQYLTDLKTSESGTVESILWAQIRRSVPMFGEAMVISDWTMINILDETGKATLNLPSQKALDGLPSATQALFIREYQRNRMQPEMTEVPTARGKVRRPLHAPMIENMECDVAAAIAGLELPVAATKDLLEVFVTELPDLPPDITETTRGDDVSRTHRKPLEASKIAEHVGIEHEGIKKALTFAGDNEMVRAYLNAGKTNQAIAQAVIEYVQNDYKRSVKAMQRGMESTGIMSRLTDIEGIGYDGRKIHVDTETLGAQESRVSALLLLQELSANIRASAEAVDYPALQAFGAIPPERRVLADSITDSVRAIVQAEADETRIEKGALYRAAAEIRGLPRKKPSGEPYPMIVQWEDIRTSVTTEKDVADMYFEKNKEDLLEPLLDAEIARVSGWFGGGFLTRLGADIADIDKVWSNSERIKSIAKETGREESNIRSAFEKKARVISDKEAAELMAEAYFEEARAILNAGRL